MGVTLVRADLGTPVLATCPVCKSSAAWRYPITVLTDSGVVTEPWVLFTCRDCGHLSKAPVSARTS